MPDCKITDNKCAEGTETGRSVKCYRCPMNYKTRSIHVEAKFIDYQFILDQCKLDDFDPNEACSRIFAAGVQSLRRVAV